MLHERLTDITNLYANNYGLSQYGRIYPHDTRRLAGGEEAARREIGQKMTETIRQFTSGLGYLGSAYIGVASGWQRIDNCFAGHVPGPAARVVGFSR